MNGDKPQTYAPTPKTKINCDQVAWINDVLKRHRATIILATQFPSISRLVEVSQEAALIEIMETLNLEFEDDLATTNAIGSREIRETLYNQRLKREGEEESCES